MAKPSTTKTTPTRLWRAGALLAALLTAGCGRAPEGETCQKTPDASAQSTCASGLACQTPPGCVSSYCCPTPATMSTNANCNGTACVGS